MKNILNYYYKIIIDDSNINENGYFSYNNHLFCLYQYKRNINEIEALDYLNKLMLSRKISVNKIIKNVFNQVLTYYNNVSYVLVMINYEYRVDANFKYILSFPEHELDILKRNNWGKLWSIKVDYIEYQISHINNSYPILNSSVYYYIGLAENAISYFNMLDLSNVSLYISHRRINEENIYNPLELIIDVKVRDIAEYIKYNFFNNDMTINAIKEYLNDLSLENIDYLLLYIRMIYPSYYFDLYEEIINNQKEEKEINRIIDLSGSYENLLFEIYRLFKRRVNIIGIDWINNKYM